MEGGGGGGGHVRVTLSVWGECSQPFPMFADRQRGVVEAEEGGGEKEGRSMPLPALLPSAAVFSPEWSVSTGSAWDEMSYLRLILIS